MLVVIEKLFAADEAVVLRQHLDGASWQDGRLTAGGQAKKSKVNQQLDDSSELAKTLGEEILNRLSQNPQFCSAALAEKIYPPKFNRYHNGGYYGTHADSAVMSLPGTGELMRTDLSATLFLSEPDSYQGGELCIETEFGVQEVKLAAGDLVLYPSSSLHQVTPVVRGSRVCAFFWIQSMVRGHEQRAMLYDLDQSIQGVSDALGGDHNEVLRLTSVYHNLVRHWCL
jgi:PKHD-type hydroxylase